MLFRDNTDIMEWITHYITDTYKYILGTIFNILPFSVAEVLVIIFIVFCIWYIIRAIIKIKKEKNNRIPTLYSYVLGATIIALSVSTSLTFLWGINYYAQNTVARMGVTQNPVATQDLINVTKLFANMLNNSSQKVPRDENNLLDVPRDYIYEVSTTLYDPLEEKYPFLKGADVTPKNMMFSWYMSETNYTGIFFPYTGEANVNKDQPLCLLPSTIAHELAHVRGVAPEGDCNFIAVLACEESGNDIYMYSGRLLAYIHLSNALIKADNETAYEIYQTLDSGVLADLADHSEFWQQYDSPVSVVANNVYDDFLQSYGQVDGVKSYGRVVDLLCDMYS